MPDAQPRTSLGDPVRLCLIGEGAIADIHMQALAKIDGVSVVTLVYGQEPDGRAFAAKWQIPKALDSLDAALENPAIDGVIVASPSDLHPAHAIAALRAGKHVLVEIPMATNLADCEALAETAARSDHIAMVCHTRRFSPAHRRLKDMIDAGRFELQHLVAETYFLRRTNLNMFGNPRTWEDSLLWHHACHSIDLFIWLTGDDAPHAVAQVGPNHRELGVPMDMTIGLRSRSGALLSLAQSFNNHGPFGGFYRYIGDSGTYHIHRDELRDADRQLMPLEEGSAFEAQDRHFVAAIRNGDRVVTRIADGLPAMKVIDTIACTLRAQHG